MAQNTATNTADAGPRKLQNEHLESLISNPGADPVQLINIILHELAYLLASDILFEPTQDGIRIRARIDGVLYEAGKMSHDMYAAVASRIKIICDLDITRKSQVQEGQFTVEHENGIINLRVEIVETVHGELIVLRLHEKRTIVMKLTELGFSKESYDQFWKMLNQKSGLVLVCGPTGSGKTTTLYSTLTELKKADDYNIMTVEDPVEFHLEGTNQIQTSKDRDFTFAKGLRTMLRLSPDIVLVGEIRDKETAEIAVDLGVETYLLNSSLVGIVAQRLTRRNCPACIQPYSPTQEEIDIFSNIVGRPPNKLFKSAGCPTCQNMAYKGRIGIYEVLRIDAKVRGLIRTKASEEEFRETLKQMNFTTLLKDGLLKCEQGITTIDEVLRNSLRVE